MAREHLEGRKPWQDLAGSRGAVAEDVFSVIMEAHLENTGFSTVHKPKDLAGIYGRRTGKDGRSRLHGIHPEYAIKNTTTGKSIYVEIKRQRAAGNAHERACKYMMPGILASARKIARQKADVVPFWWVFTNGLAKDRYYRQEIAHWFQRIEGHCLFWPKLRERQVVIEHFEKHIRPLLE
ncbi:MAG: MunI family type II restriction endonuclease [Rhodospirillales bacterium]|nr:MunI family type II restriction endonuclease [Rhodospirillales bacterium]